VGDKTALKVSIVHPTHINSIAVLTLTEIMEILQTGELQRINYERTDDVQVTRLFQGIYGVGMFLTYFPMASVDTVILVKAYQLLSSGTLRAVEH